MAVASVTTSSLISAIRRLLANDCERTKIGESAAFETRLSNNLENFRKALKDEKSFSALILFLKEEKSPLVFLLKIENDQIAKDKPNEFIKAEEKACEVSVERNIKHGIRWKFVKVCIELLKSLLASLAAAEERRKLDQSQKIVSTQSSAPSINSDSLSVSDQKVIALCFQFVVCLGVCPNLLPGVGIPFELRSGFGNLAQASGNALRNEKHLCDCIKTLVAFVKKPVLGPLVLSRHLGDILAGLLQIVYAPLTSYGLVKNVSCDPNLEEEEWITAESRNKKSQKQKVGQNRKSFPDANTSDNAEMKPSSSAIVNNPPELVISQNSESNTNIKVFDQMTSENTTMLISNTERNECSQILQQLLVNVYPPLVVRELIVLQGRSRKKSCTKPVQNNLKCDKISVDKSQESEKETKGKSISLKTAPKWLRQVCGRILSEILMKDNGVRAILKGILEVGLNESSDHGDWQKCDAVAKIIASCPSQAASVEDYYSQVCPQVIELLHVSGSGLGRQFIRVATSTIPIMLQCYPELADKYILKPLMAPFIKVTEQCESCQMNSLVVDEATLAQAVEDIHKVFVVSFDAAHIGVVIEKLATIIHPLFELFCFVRKGVSHLRAAVQEIVIQYLKHTDCDTAKRTLYALAFREHPNGEFGLGESSTAADTKKHQEIVVKLMNDGYKFANGDRGGVIILYKLGDNQTRPGGGEDILAELEGVGGADAHENRALSLVELILPLKNHNIAGEFFLYLMQKLTSFISWKKEELPKKEESGIEHLQGTPQTGAFHESNLLILSLLALMCEKLGPSILKSTDHMLAFIRATLERGCSLCKQEQLQSDPFLTETLSMAMGMLSAILGGAVKIDSSDRKSLQALIPFLESLSNQHLATEVQEMANDLRIAIATHGAVWSQKRAAESLGKRDPASEAVVENGSRPCQRDSHKGMSQSEFVTAFKDLTDPLLPVRGFAMVRIAALIYAKDAEAIKNADTLLEIFEQQLAHDDSYIYLAAIKGLVALGSVRTEKVISSLTREMTSLRVSNVQRRVANTAEIKEKGLYVGNNEKDHGRPVQKKRSVELRLKLVEALVKVTQDCGEMLPKYSQLLISTLLSGVHDPEALVRASSLSNLADVFLLLRFSIGPIIHEVFNCLHSVLQTDRSEHVRRAAVNVITLLLKGLGADSLQVLDSVLKELYRLLKTVDETDPDEITRTHARAALGELDTIMRTFLFPCPSYTKRIQVLP